MTYYMKLNKEMVTAGRWPAEKEQKGASKCQKVRAGYQKSAFFNIFSM
jgi:hypothetical protein